MQCALVLRKIFSSRPRHEHVHEKEYRGKGSGEVTAASLSCGIRKIARCSEDCRIIRGVAQGALPLYEMREMRLLRRKNIFTKTGWPVRKQNGFYREKDGETVTENTVGAKNVGEIGKRHDK